MDYDVFFSNSFPDCSHHSSSTALQWNVRCSFSGTHLRNKTVVREKKKLQQTVKQFKNSKMPLF